MAHGKPVIGVKGQGISDVIQNGSNGLLVEAHAEHELARAVLGLLKTKITLLFWAKGGQGHGAAGLYLDLQRPEASGSYRSLMAGRDADV